MILYLKNSKNFTQNLVDTNKQLQQCSRLQNQLIKSVAFLYTNNEKVEKEYRETIPFMIASKKLNT
jgi:hypothetical protein